MYDMGARTNGGHCCDTMPAYNTYLFFDTVLRVIRGNGERPQHLQQ